MKKYFIASFIRNGILGGWIVADAKAITYHTGKLTIPQEYRQIVMPYAEIREVTKAWYFILPTVTVTMQDGKEYQFAVFFGRKRFINTITCMGVGK